MTELVHDADAAHGDGQLFGQDGADSHFGMLYAVPDGMGLQFDEDTYLLNPANEIHSRYVMANTDSDVAQYLEENGWALLYEGTSAAVYECG